MHQNQNPKTQNTFLQEQNETAIKAKPFIKWAGGKTQLLKQFKEFYPEELKEGKIKSYYEPFLGGGAVFFDIAQNYKISTATLWDNNEELILAYKVVQKDVYKLIEVLDSYASQYLKLDSEKRKMFYYQFRKNYNLEKRKINYNKYSENWIIRSAQMIFLNKTCFNGLFRVNSKGEFNVPSGTYKNPKILDETNLMAVSKLLQIAEIKIRDFSTITNEIKSKSFVYFDPPYRPVSKTANFTSYTRNPFNDDMQIKLSNVFDELDRQGMKVMLSNSDPKNENPDDNFFGDIYGKHRIERIQASRMINSNGNKRGKVNEIVVMNY